MNKTQLLLKKKRFEDHIEIISEEEKIIRNAQYNKNINFFI